MYFAIATRAWCKGSLSSHSNMSFNWSWSNFVRFGPTADANMPTHWKMGSSDGAPFFLHKGVKACGYESKESDVLPMHLQTLFDVRHDCVQERLHLAAYGDGDVSNCDESCHSVNVSFPLQDAQAFDQSTYLHSSQRASPMYCANAPSLCASDVLQMSACRTRPG